MSDATQPTNRTASDLLDNELPFGLALEDFENATSISKLEAKQTLEEVWRMTQNPRMLEIEQESRHGIVSDVQLAILADEQRGADGDLNPTRLAKTFIANVRSEYAHELSSGPSVETLNPELANVLR